MNNPTPFLKPPLDTWKIPFETNSIELKKMNKIDSNKKIYKILDKELKEFIHSIQILIS